VTLYEFLEAVHLAYRPRSYLEIGVKTGRSLALSRTKTIAVDPDPEIAFEIGCDLQLVQETSDEFFARDDGLAHFPNRRVDLAFVDGLHLVEFALRDFMNVEQHAEWTSVIVIDDVLPRGPNEASRERGERKVWTGDVFKIGAVLAGYRPDLLLLSVDTEPTGTLVILGADPHSTVLAENYDAIVATYASPDPQEVPDAVVSREAALEPSSIANSSVWDELRIARSSGLSREEGWDEVRRSVESAARPAAVRRRTGSHSTRKPDRQRRGKAAPLPRLAAARRRLGRFRRALRGRDKDLA
jgi:hypothetical protein